MESYDCVLPLGLSLTQWRPADAGLRPALSEKHRRNWCGSVDCAAGGDNILALAGQRLQKARRLTHQPDRHPTWRSDMRPASERSTRPAPRSDMGQLPRARPSAAQPGKPVAGVQGFQKPFAVGAVRHQNVSVDTIRAFDGFVSFGIVNPARSGSADDMRRRLQFGQHRL